MSKQLVQCAGSGMKSNASLNAKRASCPRCHRQQDVAPSNGRIRKHMRLMTTKQLRRSR